MPPFNFAGHQLDTDDLDDLHAQFDYTNCKFQITLVCQNGNRINNIFQCMQSLNDALTQVQNALSSDLQESAWGFRL